MFTGFSFLLIKCQQNEVSTKSVNKYLKTWFFSLLYAIITKKGEMNMNWSLLKYVPAFFIVALILVLLWGVRQMWKSNNKFLAFVFFIVAAGGVALFYGIYGQDVINLFH